MKNKKVKSNISLIVYLGVIGILSFVSILIINKNVTPEIDMSNIYESFSEYKIEVQANGPIKKEMDRVFITEWQEKQDAFYIQLFDNSFGKPPTEKFKDLAEVPEKSKKFQMDVKLAGTQNTKLAIFLMFYDEDERLQNEIIELTLKNPRNQDKSHTNKIESYSFTADIVPKAKYFKVAIKIIPSQDSKGFVRLEDLDIIFE